MVSNKPELTYHSAPQRLIAQAINEERVVTRPELEVLFMRHCIGREVRREVIENFRDLELKRILAIELYRANVEVQGKDKYCIIQQITLALGIHKQTVKIWVFEVFGNEASKGKNE